MCEREREPRWCKALFFSPNVWCVVDVVSYVARVSRDVCRVCVSLCVCVCVCVSRCVCMCVCASFLFSLSRSLSLPRSLSPLLSSLLFSLRQPALNSLTFTSLFVHLKGRMWECNPRALAVGGLCA